MGHIFDTVEDALYDTLKPLLDDGKINKLDFYGGEFDEDLVAMNLRFPVIFINAYAVENEASNTWDKITIAIRFFVAGYNHRGNYSAQTDPVDSEVSLRDLLWEIRALINNKQVIPGLMAPTWIGDQAEIVRPRGAVSVYTAHYETRGAIKGR